MVNNYWIIKLFCLKVCINLRLSNGGCIFGDGNSKDEDGGDEDDNVDNDEWYFLVIGNVIKNFFCSSILW